MNQNSNPASDFSPSSAAKPSAATSASRESLALGSSSRILSVIIVSFNTKELTVQTLNSLVTDLQQSKLTDSSEIIIIDNNSQDDSVSELKTRFAAIKKSHPKLKTTLIANQSNTGFATANNQGIQISTGEHILLLNSDTIVQPGAIQHLLNSFTTVTQDDRTAYLSSYSGRLDRLGMVAASLQNPNKTYQAQGGDLPSLLTLSTHLLFLDDIPFIGPLLPSTQHTGLNQHRSTQSQNTIEQKGWVAATALMVKRTVISEIGLLDESIFMYGEDMEWCIRARNHLYDVGINHQAKITHFGSASSHSSTAIIGELKGYEYIFAKHKPLWQRVPLKILLSVACVLRVVLFGTILANLHSGKQTSIYQKRAQAYQSFLQTIS